MDKHELEEEIKILKEKTKKESHERVIAQASALKNEYKKHVSTAITTAFGLVIALVWKDVITILMPSITAPSLLEKYPVLASLYTAAIITAIAVIGILLVTNWAKPSQKK
jgi:23S rRNA pseudoU1915 N3-methylase RlmH